MKKNNNQCLTSSVWCTKLRRSVFLSWCGYTKRAYPLSSTQKGFTLIETLVAVTLLVVSVAAPMSLAVQSLATAFYARDQVTAFYLAQEAIEAIRAVRDGNVLRTVHGTPTDLLAGIPSVKGDPFTIDTRDNSMNLCSVEGCDPLKNDGEFYGYGSGSQWETTRFTRTITADEVDENDDEIKIAVEVSWRSGSFRERSFAISGNLYKWIPGQ